MTAPAVAVHGSAEVLAAAVAARLLTALVDVQAAGRVPSWVLTGGTIADKVHRAVASAPARDAVDWSQVDLWWGDERYLPSGDSDRNETQARAALLDELPLDPARVSPMPASDAGFDQPEEAAAHYADQLAAAAGADPASSSLFDVLMLGVGPDGHVASLFPDHPALHDERTAVAVRAAPKPPPIRLTLTLPTLRRAREVWFLASGPEKAEAVRKAIGGGDVEKVPAAGPQGLECTRWLLDRNAAGEGLSGHHHRL